MASRRGTRRYWKMCACLVILGTAYWFLIPDDILPQASQFFHPSPESTCTQYSNTDQWLIPLQWTLNNRRNALKFPPPCQKYLPCDWTPQSFFQPTRIQTSLHCNQTSTSISFIRVNSDVTPTLTSISDKACLKRVITNHCREMNQKIPKVVHYVHFGAFIMTLDAFLSVVSAARFIQPCLVLFHGDAIPSGQYWEALLQLVPNIVHVPMEKPQKIFGNAIHVVQHSSDVARIQLMIDYGGVYLDKEYLMLRSVDDLLNLSMVMGRATPDRLCNGFFIAEPRALFLYHWLSNFTDFKDYQWAVHSNRRPSLLAQDYPYLIRVEPSVCQPGWARIHIYFDRKTTPQNYDWRGNYGLHLYTWVVKNRVYGETRLDMQDNVVGDMVRYIIFGDPSACLQKS